MRHSTRIALGYFLFSVLWIALSDRGVELLLPTLFPMLSMVKGLVFVGGTALALKLWLTAEERRRDAVEAQLRDMAIHDHLTGLLNRGAFISHLRNAIERARRSRVRLALIYVDLDGFKAVNDRLGHDVGDHLLVEVAQRLRKTLRLADVAARLGGDEFVVLAEPEEGEGGLILCERLLAVFRQPFEDVLGDQVRVTVSLGLARYPDDGSSAEELLRSADRAMYMAKADGRDDLRLASNISR